nr:hypothetical protein CFP56_12358 [Quercus suber]
MAIVAIAIIISFHLKHAPSTLERRVALPFGLVFWVLSLACLGSGLNNYIKTVSRYSRRQALVQSGWGTQIVSKLVLRLVWLRHLYQSALLTASCEISPRHRPKSVIG